MGNDTCNKCKLSAPEVKLHPSDYFMCGACAAYNDECIRNKSMPDWKSFHTRLARQRESTRGNTMGSKTSSKAVRPRSAPGPRPTPSAPPREEPGSPYARVRDVTDDTPIINELLCFVSNKCASMAYTMLCKLCTDFYREDDISCAKDTLYNATGGRDGRRKVQHRGVKKSQRDMEDIIDLFLELPLHDIPMFVAKDISNLPPLSMNNFDMCSIVKKIETLECQVEILTGNQDKAVSAQVTLCSQLIQSGQRSDPPAPRHEASATHQEPNTSTGSGTAQEVHHSMFSDDNSDREDADAIQVADIDSDYDDSSSSHKDLIRLATIQGNRRHIKKHSDKQNQQRDVITGSGSFTNISAATKEQNTRNGRKRECVGLFVSRISRKWKAHHVDKHLKDEANLTTHCEEIQPKLTNVSYRSFFIRLCARDQRKVRVATMWPAGALVRGYYE